MSTATAALTKTKRALKRRVKTIVRRTNVVKPADVGTITPLAPGASSNPVSQVTGVKVKISKTGNAFFKARSINNGATGVTQYDPASSPSEFAVASSRLARALGLGDVIARNKWAKLNAQTGVISGEVPGAPITSNTTTGKRYLDIDYQDGRIQKGLSDLQLFDAITAQGDRFSQNIFIDRTTGKVTGIDDDASFLSSSSNKDQAPQFPWLVADDTATKILKLRSSGLRGVLFRSGDPFPPDDVKDQIIAIATARLQAAKDYIKGLPAARRIGSGGWDATTYTTFSAQPGYLKREVDGLANFKGTGGIPLP